MIRVLDPGLHSSVQDLGRFGMGSEGVARSGAMDGWAARVANVLLDNDENAAVLEMTLRGARLSVERDCWLAITGADLDARLGGEPAPLCAPFPAPAGCELAFGVARSGCRAVLAVRGGFVAERVMGSVATDFRLAIGGLQGRALRRGDELKLTDGAASAKNSRAPWFTSLANPRLLAQQPLALVPSSLLAKLPREVDASLREDAFTVSADSDRMGLRLQERLRGLESALPECLTAPVVIGSVQLPPDGRPIILGADSQVSGGYPLLGVVASVDHWRIAQARPGERLRFRLLRLADAQQAWRARERVLQRFRTAVRAWWRESK